MQFCLIASYMMTQKLLTLGYVILELFLICCEILRDTKTSGHQYFWLVIG